MRRIQTPEEIERKRQKNIRYMSLFMLGILVFGTVGYGFSLYGNSDDSDALNGAGGEIVQSVKIGEEKVYLINPLGDVQNISVNSVIGLYNYNNEILYISSDDALVYNELEKTIGRYAYRVQGACYGKCEKDLPEMNCSSNLIVFEESDENKVYQEEKCVFIDGDLRAVDAFIYNLFGF